MTKMAEYTTPTERDIEKGIKDSLALQALLALDKQTQNDEGIDYKPLYRGMYKGVTGIIQNTNTYEQTIAALKILQCLAEDAYINQGE
jgi:hypothetical protein